MKFGEKIKALRVKNNLTQEQLASQLYVSRTAVSKWESDRGYPNIDSLKDIAKLFNVTVDELLSNEEIIDIAKKENISNVKSSKRLIFALLDLINIFLIFLPLYAHRAEDFIYSVSLISANGIGEAAKICFIIILSLLSLVGVLELIFCFVDGKRMQRLLQILSVAVQTVSILFFALSKQAYLTTVVFILFSIKLVALFVNVTKSVKENCNCDSKFLD